MKFADPWLVALCVARMFMTSVFMSYAAALPVLRVEWDMSATAAGSISTGFQLGYAVSLVACSWLADRLGARRVLLTTAWVGSAAAIAFAVFARSYESGLVLYTLVGVSQGGTYTTAIMLCADRYPAAKRGAAIGWLIASFSAGYALSLLVSGIALRFGGYTAAFAATACGPLVGAVVAWLALRATPNTVHASREGRSLGMAIITEGRAMRLIVGYTGHSWELLGMWAWAPAFVAAVFAVGGTASVRAVELAAYLSASFHVMGLVAATSMGILSDRVGRRAVLLGLAVTSAICSLSFGWLIGGPLMLIIAVGAVYGFSALGDSPVLSTALTEAVPAAYLGAALALRSLLGFGAGAISPIVFGAVLDATNAPGSLPTTWGWAFVSLGIGGLVAGFCAWTLEGDRSQTAVGRLPGRH